MFIYVTVTTEKWLRTKRAMVQIDVAYLQKLIEESRKSIARILRFIRVGEPSNSRGWKLNSGLVGWRVTGNLQFFSAENIYVHDSWY